MSQQPTDTSHPQMTSLLVKIDDLAKALVNNDPKMPEHLKNIHRTLSQYEELAHLLSEEQIAVIIEGAQKKLGIILAAETTKTGSGKGKSLKGVTADEL
jgi:hypothetical protein